MWLLSWVATMRRGCAVRFRAPDADDGVHALAQVVGQILVVVRADQTPQHVVLDALETLGEGKPVSLVLNQSMKTAACRILLPVRRQRRAGRESQQRLSHARSV